MNMDDAFQTFIVETNELLQIMEDQLISFEDSHEKMDAINSIFRAAHTIKGSAGLFGLDMVVKFTHHVESVLDQVRSNQLEMADDLINLLLLCKDHISKLIDSIVDGKELIDDNEIEKEKKLNQNLLAYLDRSIQEPVSITTSELERSGSSDGDNGESLVDNDNWHISVHFGRDAMRNGMDPLSFIRYLGKIGTINHIESLYHSMPPASEMDPESCYMAYEINYSSEADKSTIENVFEFVRDDCTLHIVPPRSRIVDYLVLINKIEGGDLRIGEILVSCGSITHHDLEKILYFQNKESKKEGGSGPHFGEISVSNGLVQPMVVEAALKKQEELRKNKDKQQQSVRVDADKLDHLINLIGELVIAGAGIETEIRRSGFGRLSEGSQVLIRMIEEVRDSALNLRMVQIGETFNKFKRVVRDVSKDIGKEIELQISGGETELDKTVVEKIGDPLTHLVRNSIDHGIESKEIREQRGKPAVGTVRLNAYHESGSIVVEVSDDGGGLNRDKILRKAIEKGLVTPDQNLSENEIYSLIFEAGFSTAEQVSNLSGRGVGMDVVRRNIESLRGSIEIDSKEGFGSTIRIRLPLTLAIIDGFMMGVGSASYVVPLDIIEECLEMTDAKGVNEQGRNFINLRGEVLPLIRLREFFHESGKAGRRENIVVVKYGNQKAGFVVDQLMGEFQTVIKPLGTLFENLKGISGSTILGSGEVALILDTPALIQHAINLDSNLSKTDSIVAVLSN